MPEVRCRHMKLFLECVDEDPARADLRAALSAEDVRLVEESAPVAWLPVAVNVRATETVWRVLGKGAREAFFQRLGGHDFDSTLLKSIVATAIRLFGVEPLRLLEWVPRGWPQIFRDESKIVVKAEGPRRALVTFESLPPELAQSRAWVESVAASMSAFFKPTRKQGTVQVAEASAKDRRMVLAFEWF
jgi:hypothetical protein